MGYNKLNNSVYQTKSFIGSEAQNNIESEVFMVLKKNNNFQQINTFPLDVYKITKPDWVTVQQTLTAYDTNYYTYEVFNVSKGDLVDVDVMTDVFYNIIFTNDYEITEECESNE